MEVKLEDLKIKEQIHDLTTYVETTSIPEKKDTESTKPALSTQPIGKCPMSFAMDGDKLQSVNFKEPYHSMENSFGNVLKDLTGTQDDEIAMEIFEQAVLAMPKEKSNGYKVKAILQFLADSMPKDATEAKLCLQSTVLYSQGMAHLLRSENCNRVDHCETYLKNAIKLLRLHNETIEALGKYRRGGEQKLIVQYVNVTDGGQAIIGGVMNGGGDKQ